MTITCDICAGLIEGIAVAAVFAVYDGNGRGAQMGLAHARCLDDLRQRLERGESSVVDQAASAFLDATSAHGHKSKAARAVLKRVNELWRNGLGRRARPELADPVLSGFGSPGGSR